jgi:hypothetical protein
VEQVGLEPTASCLQGRRSAKLELQPRGGDNGTRTRSLLADNQAFWPIGTMPPGVKGGYRTRLDLGHSQTSTLVVLHHGAC